MEGTRLVALCYLIDKSIGHGYTERDFRSLQTMAAACRYSDQQVQALLREVEESYERDRGWGLIKAAFGSD